MQRLLNYFKPYLTYTFLNILFNILSVIFATFSLILVKPFLEILFKQVQPLAAPPQFNFSVHYIFDYLNYYLGEYIETAGEAQALIWVCSLIIIVFFLKNLFRYLALFVLAPIRHGITRDIRQQIFQKLLHLPLSFFSEERKGDLLGRMTADVQEIEHSILRVLEVAVREPAAIIISLFVMLGISFQLTIFTFVLMLVIGVFIGYLGKTLKKKSTKAQGKIGDLLSVLEEALSGLRIVKAFNAENYQMDKFQKENHAAANLLIWLQWRNNLASPLTEFLGIGIMVILIWFGGSLVINGEMEASLFFVFIGMFYNIIAPAKSFSGAIYTIQKGLGALTRIDQILFAETLLSNLHPINERPNPIAIQKFKTNIEYRNVGFSYDGNRAVLQNIQLTIPKGQIVALVGVSGAGKSTLVDLLPRFYDTTQGDILIDGINIKEYKIKDLRELMGVVSQEPILFNDTIYNNIAFGLDNVTPDAVEHAAKIANAHDFILATENGYQTVIGDRGNKLSGGQRQRLTIARAVLKNPPILILDEATSSLDSSSEKLVQEALFKLMQNRTSIVIAHRLSTIQHADLIVVMQEGRIIEQGKHEELLAAQGVYKKLVNLQSI